MDFSLHWSDYAIFVFWLAIYSLIGIYHRFRGRIVSLLDRLFRTNQTRVDEEKENAETIFLGNRQLSLFPVFSSVMASFLSAVSLLGTAAETYLSGVQFCVMIVAYLIAFPVASEVYMPVFYKLRLASAHEYLEYRFGKCVRWIASVIFCLQMWVYTSLALYAPSLAFSQVIGLPIWLSLLSTGLVTTFYTALGGIRAVVWTDVFQLLILTTGMCMIAIFGVIQAGGPQRVWAIALEHKRLQSFSFSPDPFLRHSVWSLSIGGAGMVLSIFGANQTLVQRYLSCRNLQTARRAILLNIPTNAIFLMVQITAGLVTFAYFEGCNLVKSGLIKKFDQILPYVVMVLFNGIPVVRGLFLSIIFAAALSTVSSGVNSLANVVLEDIIRPSHLFIRQKDLSVKYMTIMAFVLSALIGLSTIGLAFLIPFLGPRILQFSFSLFATPPTEVHILAETVLFLGHPLKGVTENTVSSGVNSLANVVLEDIIRPSHLFIRQKDLSVKYMTIMAFVLSALIGLSTIGLAFLIPFLGPRILQFSFSLFGAIGGPILAIFTLGMIVPCVNNKGGIAGLLASIIVGLWLSIGAILNPTPSTILPLSNISCAVGNVSKTMTTSVSQLSWSIYSISYLYYTPICVLVALIVSIPVSAIFGFNTKFPVPSCLLAWQARAAYRHLPACFPAQWKESPTISSVKRMHQVIPVGCVSYDALSSSNILHGFTVDKRGDDAQLNRIEKAT
ncbi:hypothetical protein AHF37_01271 [Paragonimus kellicotti]|nr:hypothetical protein AHF37_01271 [Paragonimus kellicotti]